MLDRAQQGPDGQLRSCLVRSCYAIFVSQGAVLLGVHRGRVHRSTWKDGGPASSWSQSRSCFSLLHPGSDAGGGSGGCGCSYGCGCGCPWSCVVRQQRRASRGQACSAAAFRAVACVEVQQLELSLQLLSLRFRSAALEEALAVADPGSAACPRQAVGKLAGVSLQCQGAIAGGSVYSRPFGRP